MTKPSNTFNKCVLFLVIFITFFSLIIELSSILLPHNQSLESCLDFTNYSCNVDKLSTQEGCLDYAIDICLAKEYPNE